MDEPRRTLAWSLVALVLVALAVPWFLWRSSAVAFGLPVWLWWHAGWMVLTAAVFAVFTRTDWGIGIESPAGEPGGDRA